MGDDEFTKDIPSEESKATVPHETMSCIVGIKKFPELLAMGKYASLLQDILLGIVIQRRMNRTIGRSTSLICLTQR